MLTQKFWKAQRSRKFFRFDSGWMFPLGNSQPSDLMGKNKSEISNREHFFVYERRFLLSSPHYFSFLLHRHGVETELNIPHRLSIHYKTKDKIVAQRSGRSTGRAAWIDEMVTWLTADPKSSASGTNESSEKFQLLQGVRAAWANYRSYLRKFAQHDPCHGLHGQINSVVMFVSVSFVFSSDSEVRSLPTGYVFSYRFNRLPRSVPIPRANLIAAFSKRLAIHEQPPTLIKWLSSMFAFKLFISNQIKGPLISKVLFFSPSKDLISLGKGPRKRSAQR